MTVRGRALQENHNPTFVYLLSYLPIPI